MSTGSHLEFVETIDGFIEAEADDETLLSAYDRITDGFLAVDEDWTVTYVNRKAADLFDTDRSGLVGQELWSFLPRERDVSLRDQTTEAMETGSKASCDSYLPEIERWFRFCMYPSDDGCSIYIEDVSDEKDLRRYEALVQGSSVAITVVDSDGVVKYTSPSIERILGHAPEERVGDSAFEYVHPDDRDRVMKLFQELTETDGAVVRGVEFRVEDAAGDYLWIEAVGSNTHDTEADGFVINFRDVSERKSREKELEKYEAYVESTTDLVTHLDEEGRIQYQSPAVEDVLSHPQQERVGEPVFDYIHPEDRDEAEEVFDKLLQQNSSVVEDLEIRIQGCGGDYVWIESVGRDRRDTDLGGILVTSRDITERKEREKRLKRRNNLLEQTKQASERMISSESRDEVVEVLVDACENVFESACFYRWNSGTLENDGKKVHDRDHPVWTAFTHQEAVVTDDSVEATMSLMELDQEYDERELFTGRVEINAPVSDVGVLSVQSTEFDPSVSRFLDSLIAGAETAIERVDKQSKLEDLTRELQQKNQKLEQVSEIDDIVRDIVQEAVESDSLETIERTLCERIEEVEGWERVCFLKAEGGEPETVEGCCDGADSESLRTALEDSPLTESMERGQTVVVDDIARADANEWREQALKSGYLSAAAIPVMYGIRRFGWLEIYSKETEAFPTDYLQALEDAAKITGQALSSTEQMQSLLSGGYSRITLGLDSEDVDCFFGELSLELGSEFYIDAFAPTTGGAVVYFDTDADKNRLEEAAADRDVEVVETTTGYSANVEDLGLAEDACELGGRVVSLEPRDDVVSVEVEIPRGADARDLVEIASQRYPSVQLVAHKASDTPEVSGGVFDELTDRQETTLRLAYQNGFFETPREKTGQELAEELDITPTTFFQHMRAAEKNIFDEILEEP